MISSTLSPEAIVRNSPAALSGFGNFMTGGSLSKSSSLSNATNKIVNFNRSGVTPLTPNISSLISNISTNILNQVDNSIKNTTNFIQNNTELELNKLRNDLYSRITDLQVNLNDLQRDYQSSNREIQENIIQQETNKVDPRSPVSGIQTIIQNIQVQAQTVLDNTLRSFSKDYQDKVKVFDDNRPSNVLSKFLDLYKNAIGFVNFFGDRKNINTVEQNLKSLRLMFEESFEVAKILRQTIIKIVNQLSNLPTASPTSGGLNLDIAVPGGRLKQAGGPMVRNIGRIARMGGIAGAGLLGLGGLAAATTGIGRAKQYQEELLSSGVSAVSGEQYMSGNIVESFSAIVDRFVAAVNGLISGAKSSSNVGGGSSGGGANQPATNINQKNGMSSPGLQIKDDTQALTELGLTQQEWDAYKKGIADVEGAEYGQMGGSGGRFAGRYQMGDEAITEASKILGIQKPSREQFLNDPKLQERLYLGYTLSNFRYMQSMSPEFKGMTREQQLAVLPMAQLGIGNLTEQLRTGKISRDAWGTPTTKFSDAVKRRMIEVKSNSIEASGTSTSQVSPAMEQKEVSQRRAQIISQPAQKAPQTITLPPNIIDAGVPQQQSSGGGVVPQAPSGSGSYEVPFLPTTNPDNFLTMYSRIVYNIVDG